MRNQYSPSEFIKNIYSLIMTKITMRQARFIRRPIYIRGRKSMTGCNGLTTGRFCRFDLIGSKRTLYIGDNCEMGDMTHIVAYESVKLGDNVLIASKCFISDANHGSYSGDFQDSPFTAPNKRELKTSPVSIGSNTWIGENAVILAGSDIGEGCIIGANSIINKKISAGSIVVGNGKVIKKYDAVEKKWVKQG